MDYYPYTFQYVQDAASGLDPVWLPNIPDHYYLALGITNACNFDCPFCYYHGTDMQAATQLPIKTAQEIFATLPMLAGVIFGLEGEPLLHSDFLELMELADENAKGLTLITNGSLITKKLCDELGRFSIDKIILSIDGSDADSYAQFRKNGNFERFKRNAAMVAESFPCQLHATVFRENLASLAGLPALAKELGIGRISLQQLRLRSGSPIKAVQPATISEIRNWIATLLDEARKNDIVIELDRNFGGSEFPEIFREVTQNNASMSLAPFKKGHCDHADLLACILSDGCLFPCAGDFVPVPLTEYSFNAIFNHPYLTALRSLHKAETIIKPCRICMNDLFARN